MRILIPMAGVGERFLRAGIMEPKPLIEIEGKSMIEHVIDMLGKRYPYSFVVNFEHVRDFQIDQKLRELVPDPTVASIAYEPFGPVWGIQKGMECNHGILRNNEPVIVSYCDYRVTWKWEEFNSLKRRMDPDGIVVTYTGFHPHLTDRSKKYASTLVDADGWLTDIREKHCFTKDPMDCHQSAGMYYFKSSYLLKKYVTKLLEGGEKVNGEYYVSQICQLMLRDGFRIANLTVPFFLQWGTPEDLLSYRYWSSYFLS